MNNELKLISSPNFNLVRPVLSYIFTIALVGLSVLLSVRPSVIKPEVGLAISHKV